MSAYSILLKTSKAHLPVYVLTCAPEYGDGMIKYLRHHQCKFHRVLERRCWDRYHAVDRDVFYIEVAPAQVIDALIKSTQAKGGKVDISSAVVETEVEELTVELEPCPLTGNNILSIKYRGQDIPCTGDDCDDYDWWVASGIEPKLTPFIQMAVMQPNVTFHYDTRINIGLREYLETFGFNWNPETEMMQMFM